MNEGHCELGALHFRLRYQFCRRRVYLCRWRRCNLYGNSLVSFRYRLINWILIPLWLALLLNMALVFGYNKTFSCSFSLQHNVYVFFVIRKVVATLIMFRPFVGEIIAAKIKESNANGLRRMSSFLSSVTILTSVLCLINNVESVIGSLSWIFRWHLHTCQSVAESIPPRTRS